MYNGMKGIIHRRFQKNKVVHNGENLTISPGADSSKTSDPIIVRGYDSIVIYGSYTGDSEEVDIDVMPVDVDEVTILSTPIASFTLIPTLNNDNISIVKGRPAVAIRIVNKSTTKTATVKTRVTATWR